MNEPVIKAGNLFGSPPNKNKPKEDGLFSMGSSGDKRRR